MRPYNEGGGTHEAIVYCHEENEGPGLLGPALERAGFRLTLRLREARPDDISAPLVVAMGGQMGVYEADHHPFLKDEVTVLRERLRSGRPSLGICLGAQLLAYAAGARVYRGHAGLEIGTAPISLTEAGRADPLFRSLPEPLLVAHWHQDTFDEVPGALLLATSERYTQQVFRFGPSYGIQFHPELDIGTFRAWIDGASEEVARAGHGPDALEAWSAEFQRHTGARAMLLERLARHYAAVLTGTA